MRSCPPRARLRRTLRLDLATPGACRPRPATVGGVPPGAPQHPAIATVADGRDHQIAAAQDSRRWPASRRRDHALGVKATAQETKLDLLQHTRCDALRQLRPPARLLPDRVQERQRLLCNHRRGQSLRRVWRIQMAVNAETRSRRIARLVQMLARRETIHAPSPAQGMTARPVRGLPGYTSQLGRGRQTVYIGAVIRAV